MRTLLPALTKENVPSAPAFSVRPARRSRSPTCGRLRSRPDAPAIGSDLRPAEPEIKRRVALKPKRETLVESHPSQKTRRMGHQATDFCGFAIVKRLIQGYSFVA